MKRIEVKEAAAVREGSFSNREFLRIEKKRMRIVEKDKIADLASLWQKKSDLLIKFKEWCAQRQIPLVIVAFPDQFQVDRGLREEIYRSFRLSPEDIDLTYPNRLLMDYCRQHDIHCVDLLAQFQVKGESEVLYKSRDTHWNEAGNRLAGEIIFNYLERQRLIRLH